MTEHIIKDSNGKKWRECTIYWAELVGQSGDLSDFIEKKLLDSGFKFGRGRDTATRADIEERLLPPWQWEDDELGLYRTICQGVDAGETIWTDGAGITWTNVGPASPLDEYVVDELVTYTKPQGGPSLM